MEKKIEVRTIYSYISAYRAEIMGVAIVWVLWFHSFLHLDFFRSAGVNTFFETLKTVGYGGVDIFLFLSGIGIYNSLSKNTLSVYYKNRIKRIVPAWWLVLLAVTFYNVSKLGITVTPIEVIGIMTLTGFWSQLDNQGNWYVYFIMFIYLIAPVLAALIRESKRRFLTLMEILLVSLLITSVFWHNHLLIAVERIPIFTVGLYVSSERDKLKANAISWITNIVLLVVGIISMGYFLELGDEMLFEYGLWWYPFLLIAPSMVFLLSFLFDKTKKVMSPFYALLRAQGQASLEILIISEFLLPYSIVWLEPIVSLRIYMLIKIIFSIILGIILHFVIDKMLELCEKPMVKAKVF